MMLHKATEQCLNKKINLVINLLHLGRNNPQTNENKTKIPQTELTEFKTE